ncbi:bifunctional 5,10-methylenetetrahydrofolate dehydrogenase/5,10-methenyltetrahydrofolate cyclohydrolase [Streptosporangium sp. CA-115845]|uniref:bifunctional 5,10-methylenetetrahydrofolate dehydrogenase/5,10-methenyltetrahydrofolate cyclohydrolase n=1 Tax=Streptosporangium sp. CA-115845 TaxID=3240071 RepID=UPI003D93F960
MSQSVRNGSDGSESESAPSARLLPGGPVAQSILADVAARAAALTRGGVTPSLATVLVGDDDASAGYIRIKQRQAAELGFASPHEHLSASATQADLHAVITAFNDDPAVHGLLVQHPVPRHLDYDRALQVMDPDKDVDGMHPLNIGRLALELPGPLPCTPAGIEALLAYYDIPVAGREVVILGRGATLGRPLSILLAQKRPTANAAVTVVHTGVSDWPRYTRRADVLVAAAGVPGIIQPEHVKPGAVVIGGGVRYEGRRLLPDVDESCAQVAGAITPRVGGVGPTTVAMLFRNAITAAERATASR